MIVSSDAKNKSITGPGKGWHGDPKGHARAGAIGGAAGTNRKKKSKSKKAK